MRQIAMLAVFGVLVAPAAQAEVVVTGDLPRSAEPGFTVDSDGAHLIVTSVAEGSPAAVAGLTAGDTILKISGSGYARPFEGEAALQRWDGGVPAALVVARDGVARDIAFTPKPRPYEDIPGTDSYYGVLQTADGARLRTIVTRPRGAEGPLPAVFFVQWVSCGTIEIQGDSNSAQSLKAIAQAPNLALIRVERAGAGDSEGPACYELDWNTELAHYGAAFDALTHDPGIDSGRVVVFGSSLGASMAPLVARGKNIAGMAVTGGGAVTYFERMLTFDRFYLERTDVPVDEINSRWLRMARFNFSYLVEGKSPDAIVAEHPDLDGVWESIRGTGGGTHYGRPLAYHQQAAQHDFLAAWAGIEAPVLVIYNEFDQFEGRHGHEVIANMVNRLRPGTARFVEFPKTGHSANEYETIERAYAGQGGTPRPRREAETILDWLRNDVRLWD